MKIALSLALALGAVSAWAGQSPIYILMLNCTATDSKNAEKLSKFQVFSLASDITSNSVRLVISPLFRVPLEKGAYSDAPITSILEGTLYDSKTTADAFEIMIDNGEDSLKIHLEQHDAIEGLFGTYQRGGNALVKINCEYNAEK